MQSTGCAEPKGHAAGTLVRENQNRPLVWLACRSVLECRPLQGRCSAGVVPLAESEAVPSRQGLLALQARLGTAARAPPGVSAGHRTALRRGARSPFVDILRSSRNLSLTLLTSSAQAAI